MPYASALLEKRPRAYTEQPLQRDDRLPEPTSEEMTIQRLIQEGKSFWQIRRYLYEIEGSETRASEVLRMIERITLNSGDHRGQNSDQQAA